MSARVDGCLRLSTLSFHDSHALLAFLFPLSCHLFDEPVLDNKQWRLWEAADQLSQKHGVGRKRRNRLYYSDRMIQQWMFHSMNLLGNLRLRGVSPSRLAY